MNIKTEFIEKAVDLALKQIDQNIDIFQKTFPDASSNNMVYSAVENKKSWTQGFWTGILWLAFEITGNSKYKEVAEMQIETFQDRLEQQYGLDTHDLGFLYTLSCVSAYKISGNEGAMNLALKAAEHLISRYKEKGGFIQAWGNINNPGNYRFIIDCYMNLPLLFWASQVTGEEKFDHIAHTHAATATKHIIRKDGSTYHTYYFDSVTGLPNKGVTFQGYSDESSWSRGQAWGIYGLALVYKYTLEEKFLEAGKKVADYYLSRLPEDHLPYWDLSFTSGNEPRDSSAASIAVCGLMELCMGLSDKDPARSFYQEKSQQIMKALMEQCTKEQITPARGLLLHGVYNYPSNQGIDEYTIFGDYFYMEALARLSMDWKLYW